jgi:hypothetical protein
MCAIMGFVMRDAKTSSSDAINTYRSNYVNIGFKEMGLEYE